MKNDSNNEVKIIDENYNKSFKSFQEAFYSRFNEIKLGSSKNKLIELLKNFFSKFPKGNLGKKDKFPDSSFENSQRNQESEQIQSLPQPNYQDIKDPAEREMTEFVNQLLQEGQQKTSLQQSNEQQRTVNEDLSKAIVSKQERKSVKQVDESYEGSNQEQALEEQLDGNNLDNQINQNKQTGEGQESGHESGDDPHQSESIKKALSKLVSKSSAGEGGESGDSDEKSDSDELDEDTPVTATFNDSEELTKLNVNWTSEDRSFYERERKKDYDESRIDKDLLDLIMKYLVKTNYYVKTYGLDKKNRREIAKHVLLELEHKIMTDTYSDEKEPLAFYIDMKGQCSELTEYNKFFHHLLNEKDITIYFGYDGKVVKYLKVLKSGSNIVFDNCDMCHYFQNSCVLPGGEVLDGFYESKIFDEKLPLEEFIRSHRITRLIAISDYDAAVSIIRSSLIAQVYWFCTTAYCGDIGSQDYSLRDFKGKFIIAEDKKQIMEYFEHFYDPSYENNQRKLQLKGE